MEKYNILTEKGLADLKEVKRKVDNLREHPTNPEMSGTPDRSPEVYVAVPPRGKGIPARSGVTPGMMECCIFKLEQESFESDMKLVPVVNGIGDAVREKVYNIYDRAMAPAEPPNEYYIRIARNKWGQWVCENPTGLGSTTTSSSSSSSSTTTSPIGVVASTQICSGLSKYTWSGSVWTLAENGCATTSTSTSSSSTSSTSTSSTTPLFPTSTTTSTTTPCLCNTTTTTTTLDGSGTTSTSTSTSSTSTSTSTSTTTDPPCLPQYPTFCGTTEGECTWTYCSEVPAPLPPACSPTSTSTSSCPISAMTTTPPIFGCDGWDYTWDGAQWVITGGTGCGSWWDCDGVVHCVMDTSPLDDLGYTNCGATDHRGCFSITPHELEPCGGENEWGWNPVYEKWFPLEYLICSGGHCCRCDYVPCIGYKWITPYENTGYYEYLCACLPPSYPGEPCQRVTMPCVPWCRNGSGFQGVQQGWYPDGSFGAPYDCSNPCSVCGNDSATSTSTTTNPCGADCPWIVDAGVWVLDGGTTCEPGCVCLPPALPATDTCLTARTRCYPGTTSSSTTSTTNPWWCLVHPYSDCGSEYGTHDCVQLTYSDAYDSLFLCNGPYESEAECLGDTYCNPTTTLGWFCFASVCDTTAGACQEHTNAEVFDPEGPYIAFYCDGPYPSQVICEGLASACIPTTTPTTTTSTSTSTTTAPPTTTTSTTSTSPTSTSTTTLGGCQYNCVMGGIVPAPGAFPVWHIYPLCDELPDSPGTPSCHCIDISYEDWCKQGTPYYGESSYLVGFCSREDWTPPECTTTPPL